MIPLGISLVACNDDSDSSPFGKLLTSAPYAAITDSIRQNPDSARLYYSRGIMLNRDGNPIPARLDFEKAWSLEKREEYAAWAGSLYQTPDSGIAFLQKAIKELPNSGLLKIRLANSYAQASKTEEALTICNEIIQNPRDAIDLIDALSLKSSLLDARKDTAGSLAALEKAYELASFNEELCYTLAFKYAEAKNPKVLRLCDSLIKADSLDERAEPHYFKGVYYSNISNVPKAIEQFDRAIQYDYTFLDAHMEKGKIVYDQKKYADAIKIFDMALTVSSSYADAYYWKGKCEEMLGQKDEARLDYQRAYGLDKTLIEAKEAAERIK